MNLTFCLRQQIHPEACTTRRHSPDAEDNSECPESQYCSKETALQNSLYKSTIAMLPW